MTLRLERFTFFLSFNSYIADSANQVVRCGFAVLHCHYVNGIRLVVGAKDQVFAGGFHVFHSAGSVFEDGVHVEFALTIGFERIVVAVDQQSCTRQQTGVHAHTFASVGFNYDKAFPLFATAFEFGLQLLEKCFLELQNFFDVHTGDQGLGSGDGSVRKKDILKLIIAGRQDRSALINLGGIEEIEN